MKNILLLINIIFFISCSQYSSSKNNTAESAPARSNSNEPLDTATFAGGCFWCTEAIFERVNGVVNVVSGYAGGTKADADYQKVSYGLTDHTESIQIYFDPETITYEELVEIFFATHDPTQLNRQGPDVGRQYRSAVFYHSEKQKKIVEKHINYLTEKGKYDSKIVTEINPYKSFYLAEDYHQDYYENHPNQGYILSIAKPKVEKFKKEFKDKLKERYKS